MEDSYFPYFFDKQVPARLQAAGVEQPLHVFMLLSFSFFCTLAHLFDKGYAGGISRNITVPPNHP
jgi:hypothetical protein